MRKHGTKDKVGKSKGDSGVLKKNVNALQEDRTGIFDNCEFQIIYLGNCLMVPPAHPNLQELSPRYIAGRDHLGSWVVTTPCMNEVRC